MRNISMLELHVVHVCNLFCESCSHYSNHRLKGMLSLEDADRWMSLWSHRLNPTTFAILGGEPTIHPQLTEFILLVRKHWPGVELQIHTNGFFFERHPSLPRVLADDSNTKLCLSIHHNSLEYWEKFGPHFDLLVKWKREYGINVEFWRSSKVWTRRYRGFGATIEPFEDGNPRQSWQICKAKRCPQLFEGSIWKCAPLAYLPMLNAEYKLSPKWGSYLNYAPLEPDCTDTELNIFFEKEEEPVCGMCPAQQEPFKLPSPLVHLDDSSTASTRSRKLYVGSIPSYIWRKFTLLAMEKEWQEKLDKFWSS